ncbi:MULTISPECIES: LysR family transcriptional regulator, partial [Comamonas]|uniref:LysR family transcriptional regulator n=1 Tax=Comamonas TaxID=283 RepID=UPI00237D7350
MLHLTLRQLDIFSAVARHGSTVAAAEAVGLSQSATSAALQQLETGLGVQLFERVGRHLVLNDAGRALLPQAQSLLEQARGIEQAFWPARPGP